MKMETKTGRWKYVAIVLIAALLVGLFWSYVKNGQSARVSQSVTMRIYMMLLA